MVHLILKVALLLALVSCAQKNVQTPERKIASKKNWGFLIMSDIHVYTSKRGGKKIVPKGLSTLIDRLVPYVEENNIKFIVLLGDSTGGNQGDKHSLANVKMWWDELKEALMPLMEKGVRIVPIAGNHDFYTENHKKGYKYGWLSFMGSPGTELDIKAPNHLYYTFSYGGMDLFLLHAPEYELGKEQEDWLIKEVSERKGNGQVKLALGHVALYTRLIKKPMASFGDKIRKILEEGEVRHYVGGHEHYFWDEFVGEKKFRQTIMGTSSGTYNFVPHLSHYSKFCKKNVCEMVPDKNRFAVNSKDRTQVHKQMFLHFELNEGEKDYVMRPMALEKGEIVPFTLPKVLVP